MNLNEFGPKAGKNQKDNCVVLGDIVGTGSLKTVLNISDVLDESKREVESKCEGQNSPL